MSKKFLGKMIAGAALGGASLLVWAPTTALADDGYHPTDRQQEKRSGHVFAEPHAVKPGHKIKLIEICPKAQQHAWVWSKVTGKVELTPGDHKEDHEADKKAENGGGNWDDGKEAEKQGQHSGEPEDLRGHESTGEDYRKEDEDPAKKAENDKESRDQGKKAGFGYWSSVTIPWDAKPGTYELKGSCGEGELIITPKGWVDSGDGGVTSGDDDNLAVAGVGMLGMAALGGLVLLRQRRTDESPR